jgi:hypothetical protein
MYCDVGVDDDGTTIPLVPWTTRTTDANNTDESYHVCHKGYLSLFPFLLSLLPPDSPHLGSVLDLLRDPRTYGRLTASEACLHPIPNSEQARTTGEALFGSK